VIFMTTRFALDMGAVARKVKANAPCRGGNNFLSIKLSGKLLTLDAPGSCPQEVNIFVMYQ